MSSNKPERAEDVEIREVKWLWNDRIPRGMLSFLAGKPDQGKGTLAVAIGAQVSREGVNVLHCAWEDDPGLMTKPRYIAANANMRNIHLWRFTLPDDQDALEAYVVEHNIGLIIGDPLAALLGRGVNRFSDSIRIVTNRLEKLLATTETAFLVVDHMLKNTAGRDPLAAISGGGSGLIAAARMGFIMGSDPADEERRIVCNVKHNICERRKPLAYEMDVNEIEVRIKGEPKTLYLPNLLLEGETEFDVELLLKKPKDEDKIGRPASKKEAACEWLTTYLFQAGQPILGRVVVEDAKQYGMSRKTLYRAATEIGVVKDPVGGGRNCKWTLDDDTFKLMMGQGVTPDDVSNPDDVEVVDGEQEIHPDVDFDADLKRLLGGEFDGGQNND